MLRRRSRSPTPHLRGSLRPPAGFHHHLPPPGALVPPHYPPEYPWIDDPRLVVQGTRSLSLPSDQPINPTTLADKSSPQDGPPLYSSVPPIDLPGYPEAYRWIREPNKPPSLKRLARLLPFSRPLGTLPP
ncbi:hypothetical protein CSOJ01_12131 [Colletotrichum sojae]|uniref:Uncharacterized protein n=1 Tax=Colletotrichum sojae TaxID=2175907 RepID=A0A8H6MM04_9PEZI|nr:hypothetical protein CSOJ01_12131 [Colletotrichum sojae]